MKTFFFFWWKTGKKKHIGKQGEKMKTIVKVNTVGREAKNFFPEENLICVENGGGRGGKLLEEKHRIH